MTENDWKELLSLLNNASAVKYIEPGDNLHALIHFYDGRIVLLTGEIF